jgi:uncharacterized membrane protein YhiD involved in acid resistance
MQYQQLLEIARDFAIAVALGALIGIEREKRKSEDAESQRIAGLRAFILYALLGATAGWLSRNSSVPMILAAALLITGPFAVMG